MVLFWCTVSQSRFASMDENTQQIYEDMVNAYNEKYSL